MVQIVIYTINIKILLIMSTWDALWKVGAWVIGVIIIIWLIVFFVQANKNGDL